MKLTMRSSIKSHDNYHIMLYELVRWPMGAAIVRPPNTKYTQSIEVCLEKLPKIVKITLLQFNYVFGYGIFFTV